MNIIASIIIAAVYTFTPQTKTLEHEVIQYETVVTNEPFAALFDMQKKVEILWAQHTNELAIIRRSREEREKRKSAVERVKENAEKRKRKSAMGNSLPTGGHKK